MRARNPLKDQVAIVGIGSSDYGRDLKRTALSLAVEAAKRAIEDAGLDKEQIDGICGSSLKKHGIGDPGCLSLQGTLGIPRTTWMMNHEGGAPLLYAALAVFGGACECALVVQAKLRTARQSASAGDDQFRSRAAELSGETTTPGHYALAWTHSPEPYAAWAGRYLHDYGVPRDVFGMIAVNNRQWASKNSAAVMREPITLDDHANARMIREPLGLLDMDLPVDAAEAIVLTTAERARELEKTPVHIHAASLGGTEVGEYYENGVSWTQTAPWVAMESLWRKSDIQVEEIDLFYPYDGFTPVAVAFTEAAGFCGPGEARELFKRSWDSSENILKLGGRTRVSTNGGSLSHGRMGGFNYYTEAVRQLRGEAGERQVVNATTALFGIGSFYHDPTVAIFRTDG